MKYKGDVHTLSEVTTILRYIMDNMVMKDDLKAFATKEDLMKMSHDLRDHTTRECAKVRGDLVRLARRQDEKTNEFIRATEKSGAISHTESKRLQVINPFLPSTR